MKFQLVIALFFLYSFTQGQYQFRIEGRAPDSFNGNKIYLEVWDRYSLDKFEIKDSALVKDNSFYFQGLIKKSSEAAHIYTKTPNGYFRFVIDSGLNEIHVLPLLPKTRFPKNKLSNTEVIASKSNKIFLKIDSLTIHYYITKGKGSPNNQNLIELSNSDRASLTNDVLVILKENPDSDYTLIHLYSMATALTTSQLIDVYNSLSNRIQQTPLGLEFYERIQSKKDAEIGSIAKEFTAMKSEDSSFRNSSLLGKPYILAFGATWCIPCKKRLPFLQQQYTKYKSKGLEVVYVNLDDDTEKWRNQMVKNHITWVNVSENVKWTQSKIAALFNVTALPLYLIIDKTGRIIYNERQLKDKDLKIFEEILKSL
jgi:thiol-disulfide isomerase/thioredoxin